MADPKHLPQFSPDILATDFVPDKNTASSIHATMVQQQKEMKRIEEIIHGLATRICELRAQKEPIERSHNVNRALVASERKLPPEMLSEVFHHYLDPTVYTHHKKQLLLMRVCRRWRRIAAGTPSLWTNLVLDHEDTILNSYQIISMGLIYSGALPMTATVFFSEWCGRLNQQEAIRLLAENFHRFRHFTVDDDFYHELLVFGHENVIHAPLLESFLIICENDVVPPPWPTANCIRAPRLKTIALPHTLLMDLISFNPILLCDVTLYIDMGYTIPASLNFLASCTNIHSLKFTVHDIIQPPDIQGRSRILLPCLETLNIEFYNEYDPSTLLRTIEIPALQKLSIGTGDFFQSQAVIPLNAATFDTLFGHNHPLQEMEVKWVDLDNRPLFASVLGRLQNLRRLTISHCTIDDYMLAFLTPDEDERASDWKCPSLSELDVSYSEYSLSLLLRLVRSRARTDPEATISGGAYLQYVNVSDFSFADAETRDAFITSLDDIRKSCVGHLRVFCRSVASLSFRVPA